MTDDPMRGLRALRRAVEGKDPDAATDDLDDVLEDLFGQVPSRPDVTPDVADLFRQGRASGDNHRG